MNSQEKSNKPNLIFVEGGTDRDFLIKYLSIELNRQGNQSIKIEPIKVDDSLVVESKNGWSNVLQEFKTLLGGSSPSTVLAMVDADDSYETVWGKFKEVLIAKGFEVESPNTIVESSLKKGVYGGVFIVGENKPNPSFNDLESLLLNIRTQADDEYRKPLEDFETFYQAKKQINKEPFHFSKSKLSIYLAHLRISRKGKKSLNHAHIGEALDLENKYFNLKADELKFLDELVKHLSKEPESH